MSLFLSNLQTFTKGHPIKLFTAFYAKTKFKSVPAYKFEKPKPPTTPKKTLKIDKSKWIPLPKPPKSAYLTFVTQHRDLAKANGLMAVSQKWKELSPEEKEVNNNNYHRNLNIKIILFLFFYFSKKKKIKRNILDLQKKIEFVLKKKLNNILLKELRNKKLMKFYNKNISLLILTLVQKENLHLILFSNPISVTLFLKNFLLVKLLKNVVKNGEL